jgi:transposase
MVFEHEGQHGSQWAAISSIAAKLGMTPETLRKWVRRAETDEGLRPGLTTTERERLKTLERENRELRRANEILKAAGSGTAPFRNADPADRASGPAPGHTARSRHLVIALDSVIVTATCELSEPVKPNETVVAGI